MSYFFSRLVTEFFLCFFFSSRRRHTRFSRDWSSDVCSSDLLGLGGQRAGELDALLQPVRQAAGRRLADRLDLEEVDDPLDEGAVLELLAPGRAPVERLEQEAAAHLQESPGHDVVEHAHALEQGDVLE